MESLDALSEEIVIVGSRHGGLADIVKPIYEKGDPIAEEEIRGILGDDEVVISPEENHFDAYAVGVYTIDLKPIGHVWMCQAPAIRRWMKDSGRKYLKARITRVCVNAGVLMATCGSPLRLEETERIYDRIDDEWAKELPEVLTSLTEQSLGLGLLLLRDELEESKSWSPKLQLRIDNLLKYLPLDLSGHHYRDCISLYKMMMRSEDAEVRVQGEYVLASFVHRGSPNQMQWWVENWLPDFFRDAAESDLLGIFESARYTLEDVEELLQHAPANLFHLYQANRQRFARQLFYSALPQTLYNRLLTLLAVREIMQAEGKSNEGQRPQKEISNDQLVKAIQNCQEYFWGKSAYAVIYCIFRDDLGRSFTKNNFEVMIESLPFTIKRSYKCTAGTIANAFSNNPVFCEHINDWEQFNPLPRILILRDQLRKELML
jgi:hypothetical protein